MAFFSSKTSHFHQRSLSRSFSTDHLRQSGSVKRSPIPGPSRHVTDPLPNSHGASNAAPVPPIPKLQLEFQADDSFGMSFQAGDELLLESMSAPSRSTSLIGSAEPDLFQSPASISLSRTLSVSGSNLSHHSQSRSPSRGPSRASTSASSPSASTLTAKRLSPSARDDKYRSYSPTASSKSRSDSGHGHEDRSSASRYSVNSTAPFPSATSRPSEPRNSADPSAYKMRSSPDLKAAQQRSKSTSTSKLSPRPSSSSASPAETPSVNLHSTYSPGTATPRTTMIASASAPVSPAGASSSSRAIGRSVSASAVGKPFPKPSRTLQSVQYTHYAHDTPNSPASMSSNASASSPFMRPQAPFAGRRYVSSSSSSTGPRTGPHQICDYHSSPSAFENSKALYGATGGSGSSTHARGYKSSGSVSDGSMFVPSAPSEIGGKQTSICMKRLMSKPARPTTPTSVSVLSDPEVVDSPRRFIVSSPEPPSESHRSIGRHRGAEWGKMPECDLGANKEKAKGMISAEMAYLRSQSSSLSLSSPSETPHTGHGLLQHRSNSSPIHTRPQIHLLTSTSGSGRVRRASNISPIARNGGEADSKSPASTSYSPNTISPSTVPTPSSFRSSTNSYSRQPSSSPQAPFPTSSVGNRHSNSKPTVGISRRDDSPPPAGLTPAEIVAHTYKQQERRRAELARGAAMELEEQAKAKVLERAAAAKKGRAYDDGKQRPDIVQIADPGDQATHDGSEDASMTPYYTVFGNPSGRVVNIGSERDSAFGLFESELEKRFKHTPPAVLAEMSLTSERTGAGVISSEHQDKRDSAVTVKRKLSRKMSAKLKKEPPKARDDTFAGGSLKNLDAERKRRPSLNIHLGRRSATDPESLHAGSVKHSLDSYVAVDAEMTKALPSARNGNGTPVSSKASSSYDGHVHIIKTPELRTGKRDDVSPGGNHSPGSGKLWRLVKKISSNALKDKFNKGGASDDPPPPVPSIPAEVLAPLPTRLTFEKEDSPLSYLQQKVEKRGEPLHFTPTRKLVSSQSRPSTAHSLESKPFSHSTPASRNRPSTTTRSSSPLSSDISSSQYFNQVGSSRSSTSSYGEVPSQKEKTQPILPSLRKTGVGEHILPPEKLQLYEELAFDSGAARERVAGPLRVGNDVREVMRGRTRSSDEYLLSLPCPPPRRSATSDSPKRDTSTESSTSSSLMPTFNTENAVNTFGFRRNQQSLTDSEAPRLTSTIASTEPPPRPRRSSRRLPTATAVFPSSSSQTSSEDSGEERVGRASIGGLSQASTARPTHELLDACSEGGDGAATFRNIGKSVRPALSEKQKLDRWNDLLSKSDMAGGTIHVGTGGLLSDRIRDSQYSEC